jgi:hypothetical protein
LAIRDLKNRAPAQFASGKFYVSAAWTVIATLAHVPAALDALARPPAHTVRTSRTLGQRLHGNFARDRRDQQHCRRLR